MRIGGGRLLRRDDSLFEGISKVKSFVSSENLNVFVFLFFVVVVVVVLLSYLLRCGCEISISWGHDRHATYTGYEEEVSLPR